MEGRWRSTVRAWLFLSVRSSTSLAVIQLLLCSDPTPNNFVPLLLPISLVLPRGFAIIFDPKSNFWTL